MRSLELKRDCPHTRFCFVSFFQTKESQYPFKNGQLPTQNGLAYSNGKVTNEQAYASPPQRKNGVAHSSLADGYDGPANRSQAAHGSAGRTTPPPDYTPPDSPIAYHNPRALPRVQM